ncbi:MAG TPA: haloacid dehalogenase, partial [Desulfomonilia bacterium]|nr:haloacid dehalogenase [Desulfomonilia bacterium]
MNIRPHEIAFDFDGVVADTFRVFIRLANENYHYDFSYDDITDYQFMKVLNMDRTHALEILDVITNEPHEIDLIPNEGAGEVLARMTSISPLLVVTARPFAGPVELWFARHIPQVGPGCLRVEATGVNTAKLEVLKAHKVEYFIDDRLDTCFMLQDAGITP